MTNSAKNIMIAPLIKYMSLFSFEAVEWYPIYRGIPTVNPIRITGWIKDNILRLRAYSENPVFPSTIAASLYTNRLLINTMNSVAKVITYLFFKSTGLISEE